MKKNALLLTFLLLLTNITFSQSKMIAYRDTVPNGYNFWVYTPENYDSNQNALPLVVFLHGHSLCGHDLNRVRRYGTLDAIAMGRKINAVVLAPQNPGGPWNPDKIMNVIDWIQEHYNTDYNRMYVIGMSLGGYGTFSMAAKYPDRIAAAMAFCGGANIKEYCGLTQLPLWIVHGTADRAVGIGESQKIVNAMIACGDTSRLLFNRMPGINHSDLAKMFYIDLTYDWLFKHSLTDTNRPVNREFSLTNEKLNQAYKNIDRSANKFEVIDAQRGSQISESSSNATAGTPTNNATYHKVKQGDTLYAIAKKYHTTVDKLCQLNHLKETSILQIGQKIKLP